MRSNEAEYRLKATFEAFNISKRIYIDGKAIIYSGGSLALNFLLALQATSKARRGPKDKRAFRVSSFDRCAYQA